MKESVDRLVQDLRPMRFAPPVTHVYNPLEYARAPFDAYLRKYGKGPKEVVLVGMNPGPYGMAQTGVPFGEVAHVRDWLQVTGDVGRPAVEHPRRPIQGFGCPRSEVSGARVWGWARSRFGTPDAFFRRFFIVNYCPLVFMEDSGRNRTPDKLTAAERKDLYAACNRSLRAQIEHLQPKVLVAVGRFAEARAQEALEGLDLRIGCVAHPSPANPAANRGWDEIMDRTLAELGIQVP